MKNTITSFMILHCALLISQLSLAQIIHVPGDYPTIQQGIDAAAPGDTIMVADGNYYEQISFLGKKPLLVSSHYILDGDTSHISNTVIDGSQLTNMDLASVVYFNSGEDTTSVLCGFTITGGRGTYVPENNERCGGGIFISGSGAKIIHNKIVNNTVDDTQPVNGQNAMGGGIGTNSDYGDFWLLIGYNVISGNNVITQYEKASGGGILSAYHCRIFNNVIAENTCSANTASWATGGGIGHSGGPEAPIFFLIQDNIIKNNTCDSESGFASGAGAFLSGVLLSFNNNDVVENVVLTKTIGPSVGGLSYTDPPGENRLENNITHNLFKGNTGLFNGGGAIYFNNSLMIANPGEVTVSSNYFSENESVNGGAIVTWSIPLILVNNVFFSNYASLRGGAIQLVKTVTTDNRHLATMINNSFRNNVSDGKGGAIFAINGKPVVFNSIFSGNSAPEGSEIYLNFTTDTMDLAYSNIDQSLVFGRVMEWGGNINADPEFLDDTCHIHENSPCEDSGVLSATIAGVMYTAPGDDFDGNSRPWHEGLDMGADECDIISGVPHISGSSLGVTCYPNPTGGIGHFAVRSSQAGQVTVKIYDALGKQVAVVLDEFLLAGEHTISYNMSGMPAGIYVYELRAKGKGQRAAGKLVKQ